MARPTHGGQARAIQGVWRPVALWFSLATILAVAQYVGPRVGSTEGVTHIFAGWDRYDSYPFRRIATDGYHYEPGTLPFVAWFPVYPLLIRAALALFGGDVLLAAVAVSASAGLGATVLNWIWLGGAPGRIGLAPRARGTAIALALLYPYGWFLFGVPYSDSLFLCCALAAFVLLESGRPGLAAVFGALATATRVNGTALAVGLIVLALERDGALMVKPTSGPAWARRFAIPNTWSPRSIRPRNLILISSFAGLAGFMAYLWVEFDDPFAFYNVQMYWNHGPQRGWESLAKIDWLGGLIKWTNPHITATSTAQALLTGGALLSVPFVGRRFGWGYAVYVALTVLLVLVGSADFLGAGRYLMCLFPVMALAGEWVSSRPRARGIAVLVSAIALLGLNIAWSRDVYLT